MRLPVPSSRPAGSGSALPWKKPTLAGREGVDVGEGRLADAGGRHAVVQRLAHVVAAAAHAFEPRLDH
jgi:hypothetical protein